MTSSAELRRIVEQTGIGDAQVIERRGQRVKLIGPQAPRATRTFQGSPALLVHRVLAESGVSRGKVLILGARFPQLADELARTNLSDVVLLDTRRQQHATGKTAAANRTASAGSGQQSAKTATSKGRLAQLTGSSDSLPLDYDSFELVVGVGELSFWPDKAKVLREVHRALKPGGYALLGSRCRFRPSADDLRNILRQANISSARVVEATGQRIELRRR